MVKETPPTPIQKRACHPCWNRLHVKHAVIKDTQKIVSTVVLDECPYGVHVLTDNPNECQVNGHPR